MVNNVLRSPFVDDFFGVSPAFSVVSIPAPPQETAGSAAPYVVALAVVALASAVQALANPELIAGMYGL